MTKPFYAEPILNSPYLPPTRHNALGDDGQPLKHPPIEAPILEPVERRALEITKCDRKTVSAGMTTLPLALDEGWQAVRTE